MATTVVTDLVAGILSEVSAALGASYSELPVAVNPEDNGKRMTAKRYAVLPGGIIETEGVLRYYTVDQLFTVLITDDYVKRNANDSVKRSVSNSLMNKAHDIYTRVVQTKAGVPSSVMNVKDLSIDEPLYFEEEDTVVINVGFTITYRQPL